MVYFTGLAYTVLISELPIKATFVYNGNRCIKRSTRTMHYPEYNRWFYFRNADTGTIEAPYSRLDKNYFCEVSK